MLLAGRRCAVPAWRRERDVAGAYRPRAGGEFRGALGAVQSDGRVLSERGWRAPGFYRRASTAGRREIVPHPDIVWRTGGSRLLRRKVNPGRLTPGTILQRPAR